MVKLKAKLAYGAGLWILLGASCVWGQFSPGKLSAAHRSLEGPANCAACHGVKAVNGDFKCLNCHREIRERLASQRGLHTTQVKPGLGQRDCARCHSEHNGERFVPIRWDVDLSEFDHGKTGYQLEGSHRGLDCRKCHLPKNIPAAERRQILVKDLRRTYLGLTRDCASCHGDQHRAQLSSDCLQCHTYLKWKPATRFDHARAKYQLSAAHLKVACEKCHQQTADGGKPATKFAGIAFSSCDSCHKDPHRAAFQSACQSCHSPDAWKPAHPASPFDHSRTKFALAGKHAPLACSKCHLTSNFKEPIAHANCADCHKTDMHGGQFASRTDRGECSACHTAEGWKPAKFDLAAHRATRYPLEGRHAAVPCAKCHAPKGQATLYRIKFGQCLDCHRDAHQAQFAGPPHGSRCEDCHVVRGFRPSTYSAASHSASRFSLAGAHLAVACADCHTRQPGSQSAGKFRFTDTSCATCHEDPHRRQFQARLRAAGAAGGACESCHNLVTWRDLSKFEHASSSFPLKGAHRAVSCQKCHPPEGPGLGIQSVTFRSAPKACSGCHEDIHAGQFARGAAGTDCGRCHAPFAWKPATFDHDRTTGFALAGAHKGVDCGLCHKERRQVNGRYLMLFKPAPKECSGCHRPKVNG